MGKIKIVGKFLEVVLKYKITIHEEKEIVEHNHQTNDNEGAIDRCYQCILYPMLFQSKRKGLWKRLWRLRVKEQQHATSNNKQSESDTGGEGSSFAMCCTNSSSTNSINQYDIDEYRLYSNLVNPLKEQQLETLHQAIQSERNVAGAASTVGTTGCVLVQRGQKGLMDIEPHVIACRIWKYPDLQYAEELKAIPSCINQKDRVYACCNPTHWSRLCRPGNKTITVTHFLLVYYALKVISLFMHK